MTKMYTIKHNGKVIGVAISDMPIKPPEPIKSNKEIIEALERIQSKIRRT